MRASQVRCLARYEARGTPALTLSLSPGERESHRNTSRTAWPLLR
jgi:hypothetical protein